MLVVCICYQLLQFVVSLLQGHHEETKFGASSEELMKLVENAQSGTLEPERLSQILAAASLAVGQDCRSQLLMQLILLIQQQLAATDNNSRVTQNPSAIDDDNASLSSNVDEKPQNLNTVRKRPSDIETGDIDKENEMDKLLAWKNRIENASVTSNEQRHSAVVEPNKVSRCVIEDPASPDTPVQSHVVETVSESSCLTGDSKGYSIAASSGMTTDVVQSVSCGISPASPHSDDYPPLPTPPKPPDNLLMNDRQGLSCELFAAPPPFQRAVNCAVSRTPPVSADAARLPRLSVPVSPDATLPVVVGDKLPVARPADCAWPMVSAVSSDSYCPVIIASDAHVPLDTLSCDANDESVDSSSMKLLSAQNCMSESEAWRSGFTTNTFPQLTSVQVDHDVPCSMVHSQEPCFQQRRATRLKSPSAWISRLASPSAFLMQSGVSRLQTSVNERPETVFVSHKLASQLSTTEPTSHLVHCGQGMLLEQRHSPSTVDNRPFVQRSDLLPVSRCEVGGQLTVDDRRLTHSDDVSSDTRGCFPKSQAGSDAEHRTISNCQLSASDDLHNDGDTSRMSTDKVLMRLAGMMAVDSRTCREPSDDSSAVERSSQSVDCNMSSRADCAIESCDETGDAAALSRRLDETVSGARVTPCDVTVQSSQQATCHEHDQQQQQQQLEPGVNDDDLEEGEIVDDCSPTAPSNQRDLPQATKQLLLFLKTDPVRNSSSSQWSHPRVSAGKTTYRHRDDRREDFYKYQRTNSSSRRR